jgi:uncharacterized protein (UPF0548 family)
VVFSLFKPGAAVIDRVLRDQTNLDFTYPGVGATERWGEASGPPAGYRFDRATTELGTGREAFGRAVEALKRWTPFDVGWVELLPGGVPIEPGRLVAVRTWAGLWSVNVCRIVYVIDGEAGPVRRFGFGYGTLPDHAESGEERFLVEWDRETEVVMYDVLAFVRARHPLAKLAGSVACRLADRYRRDSAEAMRRAVAGSGGTERTGATAD